MAKLQLGVSDVEIKNLTLESSSFMGGVPYDLVPHLKELNIYETIWSNSLKANVTLDEAINLPAKFPIVGEERVKFNIGIPGISSSPSDGLSLVNELPMFVHKTSNRKLTAPQSQSFSLELVSAAYMNNLHTRISKSYCDLRADQIAWRVFADYLWSGQEYSRGEFEDCHKLEQCVIPKWSPFKTLNWLASRATSKKNPDCANYVFYETLMGFNFRSIDSMIIKDPLLLFSMEPAHDDPTKVEALASTTEPLPVVKCDSIDLVHQPEMVKNINRGCYASKLITHDIITKKITQHSYDLNQSWSKTAHLNSTPPVTFKERQNLASNKNISFGPLSDKDKENQVSGSGLNNFSDSLVMFAPKHDKMYAQKPLHEYDNKVEDWMLQRNSQMTLFDGVKFYIQCGGIPALRVGMCADIHIMSKDYNRKYEQSKDQILSGKCLVTAIKHVILNQGGNTEYKIQLELVKDGMGS